jgi:propanol-preferring alcohol dehydrogenase
VGLNDRSVPIDTYRDLIGREGELIGSNDHLLGELEELTAMAARGALVLDEVVTNRVPLEASAINAVLDALEQHRAPVRSVVVL